MEYILYFSSVAGKLSTLLLIVGIILGFIGIISFFCFVDEELITDKFNIFKHSVIFFISSVMCILIGILIPDRTTILSIGGINILQDIVNNSEELQQLPDKSIKVLNDWLDSINFEDNENISKD